MTWQLSQAHKKEKRKAREKGLEDWQMRPLVLLRIGKLGSSSSSFFLSFFLSFHKAFSMTCEVSRSEGQGYQP